VTSFPAVKGKDLIAALRGQGFTVIRIKGSHHFIRCTPMVGQRLSRCMPARRLDLDSWQAFCVISK
jgi:hypothetical protein